jgi:hypothetical protein
LKDSGEAAGICFSAFLLQSFRKTASKIARLYLVFCQREIQGIEPLFLEFS